MKYMDLMIRDVLGGIWILYHKVELVSRTNMMLHFIVSLEGRECRKNLVLVYSEEDS